MIPELQSELQRWVDEALPTIESYERIREALAALKGEPYKPHIKVVGSPSKPAPAPKPQRRRPRSYVRVTDERVRDWAVDKRRFTRPEMIEELGISATTAVNKSTELVERGLFAAEREGAALVYTYMPPQGSARRGRRRTGTNGRGNGSQPVPGTGRPAGPAPTPGALKRQQQKAKIVKPKPVKGVRV